jgi:hypothetical protein
MRQHGHEAHNTLRGYSQIAFLVATRRRRLALGLG